MKNIKPELKYSSISFTEDFLNEIKKHVLHNAKYKSIADFAREAIRFKIDVDQGRIRIPGFQGDPLSQILNEPEDSEKVLSLLAALVAKKLKEEK